MPVSSASGSADQVDAGGQLGVVHSERIAAIKIGLVDNFLLAKLYSNVKDWTKYSRTMRSLLGNGGANNSEYVRHYAEALVEHGEIPEAQLWFKVLKELEPFGTVEIDENQTIISVVGNQISQTDDMVKKLFGSIMNIPVRMVSYGGSPHNISLLVPAEYKTQILQQLNKGMFGLD